MYNIILFLIMNGPQYSHITLCFLRQTSLDVIEAEIQIGKQTRTKEEYIVNVINFTAKFQFVQKLQTAPPSLPFCPGLFY